MTLWQSVVCTDCAVHLNKSKYCHLVSWYIPSKWTKSTWKCGCHSASKQTLRRFLWNVNSIWTTTTTTTGPIRMEKAEGKTCLGGDVSYMCCYISTYSTKVASISQMRISYLLKQRKNFDGNQDTSESSANILLKVWKHPKNHINIHLLSYKQGEASLVN